MMSELSWEVNLNLNLRAEGTRWGIGKGEKWIGGLMVQFFFLFFIAVFFLWFCILGVCSVF